MDSNPRILVVDDWHDTADSLATILTLWGYDAEACYSGVEALKIARDYQPYIVLLDVGMPYMDGFQVARALRIMPGIQTTIIGVSGYADQARQISGREAGFDHYMVKPMQIEVLRELIQAIAVPIAERGLLTANGGRVRREVFAN
jgi:DNA-binding response OmpR family regulator